VSAMNKPGLSAILLALVICNYVSAQTHSDSMHSGPLMNYHRVNERLVTGGHLVDGGLATLKAQGVKVVIDLRDDPPSGQKEKLAQHGFTWINIPVVWRHPKTADFESFSETMREHQSDHVLVQCAANYRASAMTYLYRVIVENVPEDQAATDLHAVWDPNENEQWREYIESIKASAP
jgi:protein tyrosine phosphatase (PTP) superfamily phosphohydrolase (DUF442 family)